MDIVRRKYDAQYKREEKKEILPWHPAFFAELQIELESEMENLIFENEHQLGTMPKEIDILIKKKNEAISIRKNIGRIFRKHNIIEYKSPEDSLGINDFYKVLAYTYFYKADTKDDNKIEIKDITMTFVIRRYPRVLAKYLMRNNYVIKEQEPGIYYILGERFPIQLIVTSRLTDEENFWLKNLTNDIRKKEIIDQMIEEYVKHKDDIYYRSVMDIIVRANEKMFEEGNGMCDAMMEILKDRIEEMKHESRNEGMRLAKMVMRMNTEGISYENIADQCQITLEEVIEILQV